MNYVDFLIIKAAFKMGKSWQQNVVWEEGKSMRFQSVFYGMGELHKEAGDLSLLADLCKYVSVLPIFTRLFCI